MTENRFNHPFNNEACKARLLKEYKEHDGKLVIGVDFDNTIYDTHNIGGSFSYVISLVAECKRRGMTICLYTSCEQPVDNERKANMFESLFGFKVDYINWSPLSPNASKPFFNILLDDRACLEGACEILQYVLNETE